MGNQHSDKKTQSGEDTPDEQKSGCCEIPKKKGKERSTKGGRSSQNEDNDYSPTEAYPFDDQSVADKRTSDTVDLDPFEIVETEDIDYSPGVSSSDVIVSTSEGKFKISKESENIVKITERQDSGGRQKIALEDYFPRHSTEIIEEINVGTELQDEGRQEIQLENYFPRHSREIVDAEIDLESKHNNTWDMAASNLFANAQIQNEKRECKTNKAGKDKTKKDKRAKVDVVVGDQARYYMSPDQTQAQALVETKQVEEKPDTKDNTETCEIKSSAQETVHMTDKSEQFTEQNDHLCTSGRLVANSGCDIDNNKLATDIKCNNVEPVHNDTMSTSDGKYEHVYDSIDPAYRLYDTINKNKSDTTDENKHTVYENMQALKETTPHQFGDSTGDDSLYNISSLDTTNQTETVFEESLEDISLSREMIVRDNIEIKPTGSNMANIDQEYKSPSDNENNQMSTKTGSKESVSTSSTNMTKESETRGGTTENEANTNLETVASVEEEVTPKCQSRDEENVPPPTPSIMDILEEEENEEEQEGHNIGGKKVSEGVEQFGDIVCKRLSQLLEEKCFENMGACEIINDSNECSFSMAAQLQEGFSAFVENIDATSTGVLKPRSANKDIADSETSQENEKNGTEACSSNSEIQNHTETSATLTTDQNLGVPSRSNSSETLKRISGESVSYDTVERGESSDDDGLPDYFQPEETKPKRDSEILGEVLDVYTNATTVASVTGEKVSELVKEYTIETTDLSEKAMNLQLRRSTEQLLSNQQTSAELDELQDITPTAEAKTQLAALTELAKVDDGTPVQYEGRHSIPCTESDLDISEQRDDMSTDSMLADDEAEETMEILFTKTYTEPVQGAEVFLSCTVVNSAYKNEQRGAEQWLSDDALEYLEANASDIMSTAFMKAKKEMKDIQTCLQSLRKQMEHFHTDVNDVTVPDTAMNSLSPDYMGLSRKAVTD